MRVLLASFGTRGDVQPLLALAVALKRAGHEVLLAAPPNLASEAAAFEIAFRPCGRDSHVMVRESVVHAGANPIKLIQILRESIAAELREEFSVLVPLARDADIVVGAGLIGAASSAAEAAGIPFRYVAYFPELFPSRHHAPVLVPHRGLPSWINRMAWATTKPIIDWIPREAMNKERAAIGLAPLDRVSVHVMPPERTLFAMDPEIAPLAADMVASHPPTGSWRLPDERPLGEKLEAFLRAGPPPVYVGFGSMPDKDPAKTTHAIVEAARNVGCRILISAGWADIGGVEATDTLLAIDAVPHDKLFPRVAVVVHHGGAGTSTAAARAGVPQIIVPHILDQFAWARRIHRLGLGPAPLPKAKFDAASLAARLEEALKTSVFLQLLRVCAKESKAVTASPTRSRFFLRWWPLFERRPQP